MTLRRGITTGSLVVAVATIAIWAAQRDSGESEVLGTKVKRCQTADGASVVSPGIRRLTAQNAPLTVTVSGGRVASVLAPPLKIEPGSNATPPVASFTIGRPQASGGTLAVDVTFRNLTGCTADVSLAQAVAQRGGQPAVVSRIRFGTVDRVVVAPGQGAAGSFAIPLRGDGTYEITASAYAEIVGLVR